MGWHKNGVGKWNLKKYAIFLEGEIIRYIEQAHQVTTANRNPSATSAPPFLDAKITNWDMLEKNKSVIIKAKQEGKSTLFVSQMYSKSLTERRNAALKYRADLKEQDPSIQSYVKFPTILMIKHTGERKYSLEKEFWAKFVSFERHIFFKSLVLRTGKFPSLTIVVEHHHLSIFCTFWDFLLQPSSLQLLMLLTVSLTYDLTVWQLYLGY